MSIRAYPHTEFAWYDQSQITQIKEVAISKPNVLIAFTSNKGPEYILQNDYTDFHKYYGDDISFAKHGQPLLQAAVIADNGGIVFSKRIVAPDSTLANVCVFGTVSVGTKEQKRNNRGELLFLNETNNKEVTEDQKTALIAEATEEGTTVPTFKAIEISPAVIKYEVKSYANCKNTAEIVALAEKEATDSKFPLFMIADNGRGISGKSFSITPEYNSSKTKGYMRYYLNTIENSKIIESIPVCMNHSISENSVNRSLYTACKQDSYNLVAEVFFNEYDKFIAKLAELSGNTEEFCNTNDILNGIDLKSNNIQSIKIDPEGTNFTSLYGIELKEGSNGSFSDAPFGTPEYEEELLKFFSGDLDDSIYDLDNFKFDVILDANYPTNVKRAIEALVMFREDCMFMEDAGIQGLDNMEEILDSADEVTPSKFIMAYPIYYDVLDPYTGKQITVTSMYTMGKLLIPHFSNNSRYKPMCGELNGFTIDEAIPGTENFVPKNVPGRNQKEELADARINHLGKYDGVLCFETVWTSQEEHTQLSYGNNVLAIQEVVKAIRKFCPANRFSMLYGSNLQSYKEDVNDIVNEYKNNFASIAMAYSNNTDYEDNKIYAAVLEFKCKNFNIAEQFKIYVV